jgi:hypothetical protein
MPEVQISQFTATEPTAKQNGEDCMVSLALQSSRVRCLSGAAGFFSCEPVSKPHAQFLDTFHASDTGGQFGAQQSRSMPGTGDPQELRRDARRLH